MAGADLGRALRAGPAPGTNFALVGRRDRGALGPGLWRPFRGGVVHARIACVNSQMSNRCIGPTPSMPEVVRHGRTGSRIPPTPTHALRSAAVRRSTAIRAAAVTVLAAGVAAPLLRRRLRLTPPVVIATAAAAPFALCVLVPRSRARDVGTCVLQMWAYVATYKMPNDDPEALEPARPGRLPGQGRPRCSAAARRRRCGCSARSARPGASRRGRSCSSGRTGSGSRSRTGPCCTCSSATASGSRAARRRSTRRSTSGCIGYWAVPTAPPWYAAAEGLMDDGRTPELRRMMVEYGEQFWRSGWAPLYGVLGGNPLAAMPSLHFATSVTAAHVLAETGAARRVARLGLHGALGLALVYLGEHYVVDLAAGLALAEGVRAGAPAAAPLARPAVRAPCRRSRRGRAHEAARRRAPTTSRRARRAGRASRGRRGRRRGSSSRRATCSCSAASSSPRSPASTSCCRSSRASRTPGSGSRTAARAGCRSRCCSRSGCSAAT